MPQRRVFSGTPRVVPFTQPSIPMPTLHCPKCSANMESGFVLDETYGGVGQSNWTEGEPKKSFWTTTKARPAEGVPIGAFRCQKCGFLEFYADAKFAAQ